MTNMKLVKNSILFAALLFSSVLFSCESEDPVIENDEEVITDVTLKFTELDGSGTPVGDSFEFLASDPQGVELGNPTIETVNLLKGKTYRMEVLLYNSIANEDITEEVEEESDEHQFFFLGSGFTSSILTIAYDDPSGENIGLQNILSVSASPGANATELRVVLRHDLNKGYPGTENPNFTNFAQAGGESDLDITFPVQIN
ncbi:hypothetical protein JYB64_08295 [Algoriphagus aestuarii]|nr:hypothetical protein [Algoriphagus aestuarii]